MYSKKEDFLNQLQFELGHRWPNLDLNSVDTIDSIADLITKKHNSSKWPFLRFLPFYFGLKSWIENKTGNKVRSNFDLNNLSKSDKVEITSFIESNFEKPITFRRPNIIKTIVFLAPLLLVFAPLLISTYLVTAKDFSGWLYISALIGLLLSLALFKITAGIKNSFSPPTLLDYSKAFFVVNNQRIIEDATREDLVNYLCASAEDFYKEPFTSNSQII